MFFKPVSFLLLNGCIYNRGIIFCISLILLITSLGVRRSLLLNNTMGLMLLSLIITKYRSSRLRLKLLSKD